MVTSSLSGEQLSCYAAGFFDGEGCVEVYRNGQRGFNALLTITNTDRAPLDLLCRHFGGIVRERKHYPINRRRVFRWAISRQEGESFARSILPFAVTKREQLVAYLEMRSLIGQEDRYEERLAICAAIRAMKASSCL